MATNATSWPAATSCLAVSNATIPPRQCPPIRYGPSGWIFRMAPAYFLAESVSE